MGDLLESVAALSTVLASYRERNENGLHVIAFDQGPMKPIEQPPQLLPPDAPRSPHIAFSTVRDWQAVAAGYATIVEKQLQGFSAAAYLPKFPAGAGREAKIRLIVEKLNREIRYTGIEFGEASVVPRTPAEVIKRKYGDCKDKSTLAVALLRAAGIEAHVALLLSSTAEDVEPDLPGMDAFNHAIVYAPGSPDIWLDPTDPDLRVGVISPPNQSRLALVARPRTTALIRTPDVTAEENKIVETREFFLSELGKAKVIEASETSGPADRWYRAVFGDRDQKALRETLKQYITETYGEAKIANITHGEGDDLAKPFTLKIELEDAPRGFSARTEAVVAIFISQIASRLPAFFRTDAKDKNDPKDKNADDSKTAIIARSQEFAIPEPFTQEWRYKITAPDGFRIRQLPDPKEETLGLARLESAFTRVSDTQVSGTLRFTMSKRRFTAAEGLALRDAIVELTKRKPILIFFDQLGETYLASGKVKEALAAFSGLRKLHPGEALHSLQFARALLAAGAGESARAEARRAVAIEPNSAQAYVQLAEILKHDLVGRPMVSGFDRDGAVAAYQKALELEANDAETHANLAILLEHNRAGERYGDGSRLVEAIAEYKKILDKLAGLGLPQNYPIALLRAGRMADLQYYLRKQPDSETNQTLMICAEATLNSSKAALALAGGVSGVSAKQKILASAGQTLLLTRRYDLAADLFEASAAGAPNPASLASFVQVLRHTKPIDVVPAPAKEPEDAVRILLFRTLRVESHEKDWAESLSVQFSGDAAPDVKEVQRGLALGRTKLKNSGFSTEVGYDLMHSAITFTREGSDETGYVVRMNVPSFGNGSAPNQVFFVVKEEGGYRILAMFGDVTALGRLVLRLADEGRTDLAKLWLDRLRREMPAGSGDDPLSGPLFSRIWRQGESADPASIRRAAALLLIGSDKTGGVIKILEEARKNADAGAVNIVSAALAEAYLTAKQYRNAMSIAEELLKSLPQSPSALAYALRLAYAAGGRPEADRIAKANLDRFAQNAEALRSAATIAMIFGDVERSSTLTQQIIASGRGQANDYNQLAWGDLMAGKVTATSLEAANKGMLLANNESTGLMHTLAAVDAELGKESDARAVLLQRMTLQNVGEPDDDEWYVFGRIAEQYGLGAEAAGMYRKLSKPKNELAVAASSYGLAQKRLKAIGKP